MFDYNSFKILIVDTVGLEKDALHIYIAIFAFLLSCLIFRWRAYQWRVLALVLVIALAGEWLDYRKNWADEQIIYWSGHLHDIWNTMLAPVLIFLAARYSRIFVRDQQPPEESGDEPEV